MYALQYNFDWFLLDIVYKAQYHDNDVLSFPKGLNNLLTFTKFTSQNDYGYCLYFIEFCFVLFFLSFFYTLFISIAHASNVLHCMRV